MAKGQMYDINGNRTTNNDLQNKGAWCEHGLSKEYVFVEKYGHKLGLIINPEKGTNKYAPDLCHFLVTELSDLKTQNTPFFTAGKYGYDPQYTVTFNKNDADRYRSEYPEIDIYFWVDWVAVRYFKQSTDIRYCDTDIRVKPMYGVWKVAFKDLDEIIKNSPLHEYQERINDNQGNAKESFLINLKDPRIKKESLPITHYTWDSFDIFDVERIEGGWQQNASVDITVPEREISFTVQFYMVDDGDFSSYEHYCFVNHDMKVNEIEYKQVVEDFIENHVSIALSKYNENQIFKEFY